MKARGLLLVEWIICIAIVGILIAAFIHVTPWKLTLTRVDSRQSIPPALQRNNTEMVGVWEVLPGTYDFPGAQGSVEVYIFRNGGYHRTIAKSQASAIRPQTKFVWENNGMLIPIDLHENIPTAKPQPEKE